MKGWMYILECADGSYYTGSSKYLNLRVSQHQSGKGANHTKERLPVKLVYFEEYYRIDWAFYREKQVQGWSRKKKEALINNASEELHELSRCLNETSHVDFDCAKVGFDSAQPTFDSAQPTFDSVRTAVDSDRTSVEETTPENMDETSD